MSLMLTTRGDDTTPPGGDPPPSGIPPIDPDTTPYAIPTSPPYNAPTPCVTPTPDGTGSTVHPSVIDFATMHGQNTWHGWRFWMAVTPYRLGNDDLENPCILVSSDGYTWQAPTGLTNPIDPNPGNPKFNSDTDLAYDPDEDRLVVYWREADSTALTETIHAAESTDGVTWTKHENLFTVTGGTRQALSPSVVRVSASDWRMWTIGLNTGGEPSQMRTAPDPLGPWSVPQTISFNQTPQAPWHTEVRYLDGAFWQLVDAQNQGGLYPAKSTDGITWTLLGTASVAPVMASREGEWDTLVYRATFTPHENGTHFRVWYSAADASSPADWHTGYTHVPRSLWP